MNNCNHQLEKMHDSFLYDPNNEKYLHMVCVFCGHVRKVYGNGTIIIEKEYGTTTKKSDDAGAGQTG